MTKATTTVTKVEEEMAAHPSILAWRMPWREEPVKAQSIGLQSQTGVKQLITVQHSPRRTKENWDFQGSSVT